MRTVLVIDDNPAVHTALDVLLSLADIRTIPARSPEEGMRVLARMPVDLVVQDMNFSEETTSGEEGVALFRDLRQTHPDLPIILLTAWTHLEAAVALVKAGAADYLSKPWDDRILLATIENLLELGESARVARAQTLAQRRANRELRESFDLRGLVFAAPATERAVRLACQVARADVPVLITGPNGAGKERFAEIIQANSSVRNGPFVVLNCGALPTELIEAELFGAEAGAYTGATRAREGKFAAADGGTLFLDEIANLPAAGQMKLLRVLETGRFERLGGNRERQVHVRVISATNADIPALIRAGQFREDLYYRLNLIEIQVPPLSERRDDVLPLAEHFLGDGRSLTDAARARLVAHTWPGNVRELKNVIQRATLLHQGTSIDVDALGLGEPVRAVGPVTEDEPDAEAIESALRRHGGIIAQAAAELGLSRQALYRRMHKLGIAR